MRLSAEFVISAESVEERCEARREECGRGEARREQLRLEHDTSVWPRVPEPHAAEHSPERAGQRRRGTRGAAAGRQHMTAGGQAHLTTLQREPVRTGQKSQSH